MIAKCCEILIILHLILAKRPSRDKMLITVKKKKPHAKCSICMIILTLHFNYVRQTCLPVPILQKEKLKLNISCKIIYIYSAT